MDLLDARPDRRNARLPNKFKDCWESQYRRGLWQHASTNWTVGGRGIVAFGFLVTSYRLRQISHDQKDSELKATPKEFALSSTRSAIPTANPKPSLQLPFFVLQVGAMVHEENANALSESLRQMNFPVFVYKHPTDRFHLVVVGPYNSVDAALREKNELEKRGFKAIRTEWKPQAQ
jgi:hypothetical protein